METNDFFMSEEQIEEEIFKLNKEIESKTLEKEAYLTKISILDYIIGKKHKKIDELKARSENE